MVANEREFAKGCAVRTASDAGHSMQGAWSIYCSQVWLLPVMVCRFSCMLFSNGCTRCLSCFHRCLFCASTCRRRSSAGSRLSDVRMVEESQSMKDACKIMLEPLINTGRIRTGFGTSLLEEARAAGRGERW